MRGFASPAHTLGFAGVDGRWNADLLLLLDQLGAAHRARKLQQVQPQQLPVRFLFNNFLWIIQSIS